MKNKPMKIHEITSHRNGVGGNSFYVIRFDGRKHGGSENMIATMFQERGNIAVLSIPLLAENNITFGENSWRGDEFEPELRAFIDNYYVPCDACHFTREYHSHPNACDKFVSAVAMS